MKHLSTRYRKKATVCMIVTAFLALSVYAAAGSYADSSSEASTNGVLVVYKDGTSTTTIEKQLDSQGSGTDNIGKLDSDTSYAVADVPSDQSVSETVTEYEKSSAVEYAQPNFRYKAFGLNDTFASRLWHLSNINALTAATDYAAASKKTTVQTTRVAVLDTGVYTSHSDLTGALDTARSVDIVNGNATSGYPAVQGDSSGHGTHVSGIVAATAGNSLGVAGVGSAITNNRIDLIVEDVFNDSGYAESVDIVKGINYAVANGAKVINLSLGAYGTGIDESFSSTTGDDYAVKTALDSCESNNVTVVCAAGNEASENWFNSSYVTFPGDYKTCICVTATNSSNEWAPYSSYGKYKDLAAPGSSIYSTLTGNSYGYRTGTSMATPVVTGVVAAMYSVDPDLTPAEIRSILYSTATDLGTSGHDDYYGNGLVNAAAAVEDVINEKTGVNVHFSNGGPYMSFSDKTVAYGGTLTEFPTAKLAGYVLSGWYTSRYGGTEYTTSTPVKNNITLYARWTKVSTPRGTISRVYSSGRRLYANASAISGARKYQFRFSAYKSMKYARSCTTSGRSMTAGRFARGRYYYVQVRAYKVDSMGRAVYGSWSPVKSVRIR